MKLSESKNIEYKRCLKDKFENGTLNLSMYPIASTLRTQFNRAEYKLLIAIANTLYSQLNRSLANLAGRH